MKLMTMLLLFGLGFVGFVHQTFPQHQAAPTAWDGWHSQFPTKGATLIPISWHLKTVATISTNAGFRITNLTQIFYVGPITGEHLVEVEILRVHHEVGREKIYEK